MWRVLTARYALSPYVKRIRFVFKELMGIAVNFGTSNTQYSMLFKMSVADAALF
jgi:hypothetical protein